MIQAIADYAGVPQLAWQALRKVLAAASKPANAQHMAQDQLARLQGCLC